MSRGGGVKLKELVGEREECGGKRKPGTESAGERNGGCRPLEIGKTPGRTKGRMRI